MSGVTVGVFVAGKASVGLRGKDVIVGGFAQPAKNWINSKEMNQ
jgi:hypothetical protein